MERNMITDVNPYMYKLLYLDLGCSLVRVYSHTLAMQKAAANYTYVYMQTIYCIARNIKAPNCLREHIGRSKFGGSVRDHHTYN